MIGGGEGMRRSNALLSGSGQIWLVLFGRAPQLNKSAECYIFQGGVGIQKRHLGSNFYFHQQEVDLPTT